MSDLAARLTSRVELDLDRRVWPLVLTHRVLLECEELTGVPLLAEVNLLSAKLIRALLFCALKRAGAPYTLKQVGDRIRPKSIDRIHEAVRSAWVAAMPEPEEDDEDVKPTRRKKKPKPLTWLNAWAMARHDLHLSADEWLDMTPRQFHALKQRQMERWQREELLVGIIAATSANFSMCHPKRPLRADSFMLHPLKAEPEEPMTGDELMAAFAPFRRR